MIEFHLTIYIFVLVIFFGVILYQMRALFKDLKESKKQEISIREILISYNKEKPSIEEKRHLSFLRYKEYTIIIDKNLNKYYVRINKSGESI